MYQLREKDKNNKFTRPLIYEESANPILQNEFRQCTDIVCFVLFTMFVCTFIGILTYSLIVGSPRNAFAVFNSDGVRCDTTSAFRYGFFPTLTNLDNAICVSSCPVINVTVTCLTDSVNCLTGSILTNYSTFSIDYYCLPDAQISGFTVSDYFSSKIITVWAFDLLNGWPVLVGSFVVSIVMSIIFLLIIRCCVTVLIWIFIVIAFIGLELIGILFILEAKGINISAKLSETIISTLSYDTLLIVGIVLIVIGVLFLLLVICLRTKIMLGSKAVEIGTIFLFENCYMIILPLTQAIFIMSTFGATIIGGLYLYSLGTRTVNASFTLLTLDIGTMILIAFLIAGGAWMIFFFQGCNRFMHCSAVAIWYFNQKENGETGAPFCDSLGRLVKFHMGSVAITGLLNGLFFFIKLLAAIFTFQVKDEDTGIVVCCLKCLNYLFCLFNWLLRFLNDGTYVQIAVLANGYCASTLSAFSIAEQNISKLAITEGISIFFSIVGTFGIGIGIVIGSYFVLERVEYFANLQTSPFVVTFVSGLIGMTFAGLYLSMIDLSATSVLQSIYIDNKTNQGKPRFARQRFQQILLE